MLAETEVIAGTVGRFNIKGLMKVAPLGLRMASKGKLPPVFLKPIPKVDEVRTAQYLGKMARRGRHEGRKPSWKKAFVTLKQGEKPVDYGEAI